MIVFVLIILTVFALIVLLLLLLSIILLSIRVIWISLLIIVNLLLLIIASSIVIIRLGILCGRGIEFYASRLVLLQVFWLFRLAFQKLLVEAGLYSVLMRLLLYLGWF